MARALVKSGKGEIGDVKWSRLSEAQFQALHGTTWVLYDGRNISGSGLATLLGISTLEDHRGLVSRAKNNGRSDGSENPGGDLALGTFQNDAMQGHRHQINYTGGGGTTTFAVSTTNAASAGNVSPVDHVREPITDGANGTPRTAAETRTKNLTLNCFIKINP